LSGNHPDPMKAFYGAFVPIDCRIDAILSQIVANPIRHSSTGKPAALARQKKAQANRPAPFKAWIGQMPHQGLTGASSSLSLTRMIAATPASKPTRPMIQLELPSRSLSPLTADPARAEAAAGAADAAIGATTAEVAASATRIFRGVRIFFSVDEMG
jgi:hypothetical protein